MGDGGKGWAQRPIQDRKQFEENWDRVFNQLTDEHTDDKQKDDVPLRESVQGRQQ